MFIQYLKEMNKTIEHFLINKNHIFLTLTSVMVCTFRFSFLEEKCLKHRIYIYIYIWAKSKTQFKVRFVKKKKRKKLDDLKVHQRTNKCQQYVSCYDIWCVKMINVPTLAYYAKLFVNCFSDTEQHIVNYMFKQLSRDQIDFMMLIFNFLNICFSHNFCYQFLE